MKNKTTFIYTLSTEEEPNNIRYIGKTDNPKDRRERHTQSYYLNEGTHKANWLKSELKKGHTPILNVIDEVPYDEWQFWESYWIEQFKVWGFNLTNGTTGGEGLLLTKELINKRAKTRMDNTASEIKDEIKLYKVNKLENTWTGERVCNHCNNITKYQKTKRTNLIKELRRATTENRRCSICEYQNRSGENNSFYGKLHSQETIQLIKQKSKSKKILQLDLQDNIINEFDSIRSAERKTNIHRAHISKCCNNKSNHNTAGGFKWIFSIYKI